MPTAPDLIAFVTETQPDWVAALDAEPHALPDTLRSVVEAETIPGEGAAIVLIAWDVERAPVIGALCERLRTPRLLIGAVCETRDDATVALVTGADCAWSDPPNAREIAAALLARRRGADALRPTPPSEPDAIGPIRVDDRRKCITVSGHTLPLSPRLYDLLAYLVANPGRTVSRDDLLGNVWGLDFDPDTNVVDVYMHYLRRALRPHSLDSSVVTVRGRGYRLDLEGAQAQA